MTLGKNWSAPPVSLFTRVGALHVCPLSRDVAGKMSLLPAPESFQEMASGASGGLIARDGSRNMRNWLVGNGEGGRWAAATLTGAAKLWPPSALRAIQSAWSFVSSK